MSSFIERFSIVGTAGVLGLMVVVGIYGFASLLGVEPDEPLRSLARGEVEEVPDVDGTARRRQAEVVRSEGPPAEPGEEPPASPTPRATPRPSDAPAQVLSLVRDDSRPGGGFGGPAAPPAATPGPAPPTTPDATPAPVPSAPPPTPLPPTPAPEPPTPTPPECSTGGVPDLKENGNHVRFAYGAVVLFEGGQPGILVVDVAGTLVSLLITDGTEVRGQLGAATLVNGEGRRGASGPVQGRS